MAHLFSHGQWTKTSPVTAYAMIKLNIFVSILKYVVPILIGCLSVKVSVWSAFLFVWW